MHSPNRMRECRVDKKDKQRYSKAENKAIKEGVRIQRDTRNEIVRLLQTAETKITAALAATPTDWQSWYLPQLQQAVRSALDEASTAATGVVNEATRQAWQNGIAQVDAPMAAVGIKVQGLLPTIDVSSLVAMRGFMTDRIADISVQLVNKINTQLGLVAIGAQSPTEAINVIAGLLDKGGRSRANTIVRTELGRITSVAKQARMEAAINAGAKMKKQWRRSGKVHSRIDHDIADGQTREVDEPFLVAGKKLMYPRDPRAPASETINCGCWVKTVVDDLKPLYPGRKPFSEFELRDPNKKALEAALNLGKP